VPIAPSNFAPDEGDLTQAIFVYGEENRRSMAQNLQASGARVISGSALRNYQEKGALGMIYIGMLPVIFFAVYMLYSRSKYKNRAGAGAFFFENDQLVLNTGLPYPIPFDEIECVELHYSPWELEHKLSYEMSIKVIKTDGKTKRVFYKGYRTAKLATPADMKAALEAKGIRCVDAV